MKRADQPMTSPMAARAAVGSKNHMRYQMDWPTWATMGRKGEFHANNYHQLTEGNTKQDHEEQGNRMAGSVAVEIDARLCWQQNLRCSGGLLRESQRCDGRKNRTYHIAEYPRPWRMGEERRGGQRYRLRGVYILRVVRTTASHAGRGEDKQTVQYSGRRDHGAGYVPGPQAADCQPAHNAARNPRNRQRLSRAASHYFASAVCDFRIRATWRQVRAPLTPRRSGYSAGDPAFALRPKHSKRACPGSGPAKMLRRKSTTKFDVAWRYHMRLGFSGLSSFIEGYDRVTAGSEHRPRTRV